MVGIDLETGGQSMFWDGFQWVPRADTGAGGEKPQLVGGRKFVNNPNWGESNNRNVWYF